MAQQLAGEINNIVQGDNIDIIRTIGSLPASITKSWFTVKTRANLESNTDTSTIVFQKSITTLNVPNTGHIYDDGADGVAGVRFELTNGDTVLLTGDTIFYYDIQVLTSTNKIYTPEIGVIKTKKERTKSIS
jgi:hypothetical protein